MSPYATTNSRDSIISTTPHFRYPSQPAWPAERPVLHLHNSSILQVLHPFCKLCQSRLTALSWHGATFHSTPFSTPQDSICRCRFCRLSRDDASISIFITSHAHPRNILGTFVDTLPPILTCSSAAGQREPSSIAMCSAALPCGSAASNHRQNVVQAIMEGAHHLGRF